MASFSVTDCVGESRYIQTLSAKAKKFKKPKSEIMTTLRWIIRIIGILIIPISIGSFITNYNHVINNPIKIVKKYTNSIGNKMEISETVANTGVISTIP